MDIIKVVKGVHYMRDMETGIIWFNAAEMARKLGIVDKKTGKRAGTEFIKWDRFNKYVKVLRLIKMILSTHVSTILSPYPRGIRD